MNERKIKSLPSITRMDEYKNKTKAQSQNERNFFLTYLSPMGKSRDWIQANVS
jgi:hypothetical protein